MRNTVGRLESLRRCLEPRGNVVTVAHPCQPCSIVIGAEQTSTGSACAWGAGRETRLRPASRPVQHGGRGSSLGTSRLRTFCTDQVASERCGTGGWKVQNAAIAVALASICNAADRSRPLMHTGADLCKGSLVAVYGCQALMPLSSGKIDRQPTFYAMRLACATGGMPAAASRKFRTQECLINP